MDSHAVENVTASTKPYKTYPVLIQLCQHDCWVYGGVPSFGCFKMLKAYLHCCQMNPYSTITILLVEKGSESQATSYTYIYVYRIR